MGNSPRRAWAVNGILAIILLAAGAIAAAFQSPALAGGSWDTDGILANTIEADNERVVIVDTRRKRILVYRTEGVGQMRLASARSFKFDVELKGDSSKIDEIEKRGITYTRAVELAHENRQ